MSGFTPGPWIWGDNFNGLYGAGPDNEVLDHARFEGMWLGYGKSREANARLIAAAPELLDSTLMLLDVLDELAGECDAVSEFQAPIRMARNAIAKATGASA